MNFQEIDWADSYLEEVRIEYDCATLKILDDFLQKTFFIKCKGFVGITNFCIWDDTIILKAEVKPVKMDSNEFVRTVYNAYGSEDCCGRCLGSTLLELRIELTNYIPFSIYCKSITIE